MDGSVVIYMVRAPLSRVWTGDRIISDKVVVIAKAEEIRRRKESLHRHEDLDTYFPNR